MEHRQAQHALARRSTSGREAQFDARDFEPRSILTKRREACRGSRSPQRTPSASPGNSPTSFRRRGLLRIRRQGRQHRRRRQVRKETRVIGPTLYRHLGGGVDGAGQGRFAGLRRTPSTGSAWRPENPRREDEGGEAENHPATWAALRWRSPCRPADRRSRFRIRPSRRRPVSAAAGPGRCRERDLGGVFVNARDGVRPIRRISRSCGRSGAKASASLPADRRGADRGAHEREAGR